MSRELTDREARLRDDLIARLYIEYRSKLISSTRETVAEAAKQAQQEAELVLGFVYPKQ